MHMNTPEQMLQEGRSQRDERAEVLHWDGRLDNREDLLLRLRDSLGSETSNAAIARASYERCGQYVVDKLESIYV